MGHGVSRRWPLWGRFAAVSRFLVDRSRALRRLGQAWVWLLLLPLGDVAAHPRHGDLVRYDVTVVLTADGLRVDLWLLAGGEAAPPLWSHRDTDGDRVLSAAEQARWARALTREVRLQVAGRHRRLRVESASFPTAEDFVHSRRPLSLRAELVGPVPRGQPVELIAALAPWTVYPVVARVDLLAAPDVTVQRSSADQAVLTATVLWPNAAVLPDTRVPEPAVPDWLGQEAHQLDLAGLTPRYGRAAPPHASAAEAADSGMTAGLWVGLAVVVGLVLVAGWSLWRVARPEPEALRRASR